MRQPKFEKLYENTSQPNIYIYLIILSKIIKKERKRKIKKQKKDKESDKGEDKLNKFVRRKIRVNPSTYHHHRIKASAETTFKSLLLLVAAGSSLPTLCCVSNQHIPVVATDTPTATTKTCEY